MVVICHGNKKELLLTEKDGNTETREVSPPFLHKSQLESWPHILSLSLSLFLSSFGPCWSVNGMLDEWPLASLESLKDLPYRIIRKKNQYGLNNFSWNLHNKNYARVKALNLIGWAPKSIPLQFSAIMALSACSVRKKCQSR